MPGGIRAAVHFAPVSMVGIEIIDRAHAAAQRFEAVFYGLEQDVLSSDDRTERVGDDEFVPDQ
jgi:hypothetical protein